MEQYNDNASSGGIVFEDNSPQARQQLSQEKVPKMIQWVINHSGGRITNKKQAGLVLLVSIVLMLILSLVLITGSGADIEEENIFDPATALPDPGNATF